MQSATTAAALSLHLPVRQEWLDRRREEIVEPDLPIIDPHHHLVDRPETGSYLLPELLADIGTGHNITANRVPRMAVDVPRIRPRRAAPDRRDRVRQWRRGDVSERDLREDAGLRRYRRLCRSDDRRRGREGVGGDD